jgi:UDP-N-acetylmuramoyl-tripeptide--D-alanyl-D-alanine ligase
VFPGRSGYKGVLRRTAKLVKPTIGVITNIGTAHLETIGSKENVFKAKMEIAENLSKNDILIVNGDDEYLSTVTNKTYKIIKTSLKGKGDYNATEIINHGENGVTFNCKIRGEEHRFKVNVPGVHNVNNALMAIAIGDAFNMDVEEIKRGISDFKPEGLRMNIIKLKKNATIIVDCFNANLDSMKSSINVLYSFKGGRKIAVFGGMLELGGFTEEAHRQVGKYLVGKCDVLLTYGKEARFISEEVKSKLKYKHFNDKKQLSLYLWKIIKQNDVILVKGSRRNKMEKVVEYITLQDNQ